MHLFAGVFLTSRAVRSIPPVIPDARHARSGTYATKIPDSLRKRVGFGDDGWKGVASS